PVAAAGLPVRSSVGRGRAVSGVWLTVR
ncbi:MAG: hypothetical protein QOH28_1723, partial [Actinomycetota bacterium]|nr:hypothetical protein [Actinomycetota bacterium]